eukprot:gene719-4011_t
MPRARGVAVQPLFFVQRTRGAMNLPQVIRFRFTQNAFSTVSSKGSNPNSAKSSSAVPDDKGYFGRSIHYTNVHTSQLETYYDLVVEMAKKRLPAPRPKNMK